MQIRLVNASRKIGYEMVIDNVNIQFESGHIYGLHGRNGSGKSVLMKLICGFYMPTTGEILFDNVNFNAKNEYPKDLRAVIEKPTFFPDLTGYENLKVLARIQNKITDKEILESLETVNLIHEKDKKYSKYSLGMKQKLAIAQAIMEDPKVLILDEPFTGLDPINVGLLKDAVKDLQKNGCSIIFSSHQMEYIEDFCEELIILVHGKAVINGNLNEIKENYAKKNIQIKGDNIPVEKLEKINGVDSIEEKANEYVVHIKDASVSKEVFDVIKNFNITKYVVADASLNEIFIHYVGGKNE